MSTSEVVNFEGLDILLDTILIGKLGLGDYVYITSSTIDSVYIALKQIKSQYLPGFVKYYRFYIFRQEDVEVWNLRAVVKDYDAVLHRYIMDDLCSNNKVSQSANEAYGRLLAELGPAGLRSSGTIQVPTSSGGDEGAAVWNQIVPNRDRSAFDHLGEDEDILGLNIVGRLIDPLTNPANRKPDQARQIEETEAELEETRAELLETKGQLETTNVELQTAKTRLEKMQGVPPKISLTVSIRINIEEHTHGFKRKVDQESSAEGPEKKRRKANPDAGNTKKIGRVMLRTSNGRGENRTPFPR